MSSFIRKGSVVAVGDEEFINLMRLAGIRRTYVINTRVSEPELREVLGKVFSEIYQDYTISIVVIHDALRHVAEKVRKAVSYPLIVYVPCLRTVSKFDIKEYYSSMLRSYLGIAVEV